MDDRVDIKDLTISDLIKFAKKLKISSLMWIISTTVIFFSGAYGAGVASTYFRSDKPVFEQAFADFVDRQILVPLLSNVLQYSPDGIRTESDATLSLLWQLKSQDGYAQFLSGTDFVSVQITQSDDGFELEWEDGDSLIPKILADLSLPADHDAITQFNSELNLLGVAWLSDSHYVVRNVEGGLQVVVTE